MALLVGALATAGCSSDEKSENSIDSRAISTACIESNQAGIPFPLYSDNNFVASYSSKQRFDFDIGGERVSTSVSLELRFYDSRLGPREGSRTPRLRSPTNEEIKRFLEGNYFDGVEYYEKVDSSTNRPNRPSARLYRHNDTAYVEFNINYFNNLSFVCTFPWNVGLLDRISYFIADIRLQQKLRRLRVFPQDSSQQYRSTQQPLIS